MADEAAVADALASARLRPCEHCHRAGTLVGHGRLVGYAEASSAREVRGLRLYCSNRHRRVGCGRTFAVWLASIVPRRIVRARTVFTFMVAMATGESAARAWRQASSMTLRTGYRIKARLAIAGPAIRSALLSRAPPPSTASASPDAQLVAHLCAVLGPLDSFSSYQLAFERSLFA